jgi:hypothetical protein
VAYFGRIETQLYSCKNLKYQGGTCYMQTSKYKSDLMYWLYHQSGYTKQYQGHKDILEEKDAVTVTFSIRVVKYALLSKESMQVFESLRVGVLSNLSLAVLCTYVQNNI